MSRLIALYAALAVTFGGAASAVEFQTSKVPGRGNPTLCAPGGDRIIINQADRTITTCNPDGSQSVSALLKALPAGRKVVETGAAEDATVTLPGGVARSLMQRFKDLPVGIVEYGAVCSNPASIAPAVAAAIAAGNKVLRLPANCTYIPTNNATPAGVTIIGEDDHTSVISVANRATDYLAIGARATLRNVAIRSKFCDEVPQPANTQKDCPAGEIHNAADVQNAVTNWVGQRISYISGPSYTGPNGTQSHDLPPIGIEAKGEGSDAIYLGSGARDASGARIATTAPGAVGVQIFNGLGVPGAADTRGVFLHEFGDGSAGQASVYFDRIGAATSIYASDLAGSGGGRQNPFLSLALYRQSGGNVLNIYQAGAPFSGAFLDINAGNEGGAFTGNYVRFNLQGATVFAVSANGAVYSAGNVTAAALIATGANLAIYQSNTPSSSSAPCTKGTINWDVNYTYVCVATNHWKRSKILDDF